MPQGLKRVKQLAEDAAARSVAYEQGGDGLRALKLSPNETATGRFLEEGDGIWYLYMHELPRKPGQQYGDRVQCLDQDDAGVACPGCEIEGVKRTARIVINFIRYDEPKLRRGADGKAVKDAQGNFIFDGVAPALVVWEAPQSVGGRLAYLEETHGPLTKHVVTIHRTVDNKNAWMIDVKERDKPVEPLELEFNDKKVRPDKAITNVFPRFLSRPVMSYGDMKRAYSGVAASAGFAQGADQQDNVYAQAAQNAAGNLNLGALGS
jgi:hypothetical protein